MNYELIPVGEHIRCGLGHWYEVIGGGPYQYRVQPLMTVERFTLVRVGTPFIMFRSDMRRAGE